MWTDQSPPGMEKRRRCRRIPNWLVPLPLIIVFYGSVPFAVAAVTTVSESVKTPVIVELFTSEGCSSCPPADALLQKLSAQQPVAGVQIIPLEFHVDYWDNLGWPDPFADRSYTNRQSAYQAHFGERSNYTPEMVVNGSAHFVGSNQAEALSAIASAAPEKVEHLDVTAQIGSPKDGLSETGKDQSQTSVSISIAKLPEVARNPFYPGAQIVVVVTVTGMTSEVKAGENSGRKLSHSAVVRSLVRLGQGTGSVSGLWRCSVGMERRSLSDKLTAVAFVQDPISMRILAAGSTPVSQ